MTQKQLYELFSEFTAMAVVTHHENVAQSPKSLQSLFARTSESRDYIGACLPYSGDIVKHRLNAKNQLSQQRKFSAEALRDFRIPVDVFKRTCQPFAKTRPQLQDRVLLAVGITQEKGSKVDWETFLRLK